MPSDEEMGLRIIHELVQPVQFARWQGSEDFLLCCVVLFCLFHLIFCRSRSYALWATSLCILFCGKKYVRDSGSGLVFYVIVQMVFYNSAKGSVPFFFKCMNIGVLLQFMFSNLVHIPIIFFFFFCRGKSHNF